MTKKKVNVHDNAEDLSVPIPIQIFLWRQTSPFMRAKLSNICESSSVSFERVIVQNILHGLSPSLCEAINSIPRWKLIRAAFPHVIHCCASVLSKRKESGDDGKYSSLETKLLYTLHWIVLDAASECEDTDGRFSSQTSYLHSLDTIQLFIFLLIPLLSTIKRPEIESLKLLNGLRLWEPLWSSNQPCVACFITPVKSKKALTRPIEENSKVNFNMANIYLGEDNEEDKKASLSTTGIPPLVMMQDICALSNRSSMEESMTHSLKIEPLKTDIFGLNLEHKDLSEKSSPKKQDKTFNALNATYFDIAALQCLFCPQWNDEGVAWTLNYLVTRLKEIKKELKQMKRNRKRSTSLPATFKNLQQAADKSNDKSGFLKSCFSKNKKHKSVTKIKDFSPDERTEKSVAKDHSHEATVGIVGCKQNQSGVFCVSNSDSRINYNFHTSFTEAPGSTFYIRANGHLKYDVIMLAIYNLQVKNHNSKAYSSILSIINSFIELGLLKKIPKVSLKSNSLGNKKVHQGKDMDAFASCSAKIHEPIEESIFNMTLELILRLIRTMGCVNNCSDLPLKIPAIYRERLLDCLSQLIKIDIVSFKKYILKSFLEQPLQNILDCLHVMLGYCSDPIRIHIHGKGLSLDNGYNNNFGEPPWHLNGVGNKVIILVWKKLLNKLVRSRRDMITHDNIHLYQGARQLVAYMKEANGSTFRKAALSFLLESSRFKGAADPQHKSSNLKNRDENSRKRSESSRKSKYLLKKKHQKHSFPLYAGPEELLARTHLSPRTSIFSIAEDDLQLLSSKKKSLKMLRNLHKSMRTEGDEESNSECFMGSDRMTYAKGQRMSFKATGQTTLKLLSARRKMEESFKGFGRRRHPARRRESIWETSMMGTNQMISATTHPPVSNTPCFTKEKKLLNACILKSGLARFNLLMEFSSPGVLPDPPLIAALLDLEAPVVGRAALLLECACFVNKCNHGDWPNWMKYNIGGLYSVNRDAPGQSLANKNLSIRRTSGRLFHQWAESLGNRLLEIMIDESPDVCSIIVEDRDQEFNDQEEDYLNEETVNKTGSDCPHALKLTACQLLYEITAFLRETHKNMPKPRASRTDRSASRDPDRRWSSVLTTISQDEVPSSTKSVQSENPHQLHPLGRKASLAISGSNQRSDSIHESASQQAASRRGRLLRTRRGSEQMTTFKHNRSFKLLRNNDSGFTRMGSTKNRKISTQSLHSAVSAEDTIGSSYAIFEEEEEGEGEEKGNEESKSSLNKPTHDSVAGQSSLSTTAGSHVEESEGSYENLMPWVKVVVQLANKSNFVCEHKAYCHPNCYEKQRKSCLRLMVALKKIYSTSSSPPEAAPHTTQQPSSKRASNSFSEKMKNKNFKDDSYQRKHKKASNTYKEPPSSSSSSSSSETSDDDRSILVYLDKQVANLTHSALAVVLKATPILKDEVFIDIMPIAWELILENDQELAAAAATVFLISSIQVPEPMKELLANQFQHADVSVRIGAINRFGVLWNSRFQVWPRMETGAQSHFKLPPPNIDFVVPSPTIGLSSLPVVDPPWTPHFRSKLEEVTIDQKDMNSVVTATTTRRKQQQQMLHQAMIAKEDKRRLARERCWMTSVPVCQAASVEPVIHTDDHEDAIPEELSLAVATRRMSVAVVNRASNVKNLSARHGSIFYSRPTVAGTDDERMENVGVELQVVQSFFPSPICQSAVNLIYLLSDLEVNKEGISVSEVTEKTIWRCLVEDPTLFLRTFLEKLTVKTAFRELIWLLRKMLQHLRLLPLQAAHCIFNYLLGYVMFYERLPSESSIDCITEAMSLLWQIVPFVSNIYFKDLKQTLRKEQCDSTFLVAANTPSAKKLIIHGPDLSSIPSQCLIQEDTRFEHLLKESLDFFNIPEHLSNQYFLVDTKTRNLHSLNRYVRDHYTFRRNLYPQLSLVQIDPVKAHTCLQKQTFMLKYLELEKVLLSLSILNGSQGSQFQNHVSHLHEELLRLPSFPRKALETEFAAYSGEMKEDIMCMDVLHKLSWIKLTGTMFKGMSGLLSHEADLPIFLNVLNGVLVIHSSHSFTLSTTAAAYLNVSRHFKHVFASTGFSFIMPTILSVHISNQHNPVLCDVIHFLCKCFFIMHRNAFMLQMFATMSRILEEAVVKHGSKDHVAEIFFRLLTCMKKELPDTLQLMELLDDNEEMQAFDFCYKDDSEHFSLLEAIRLCTTVVAYNCESPRAYQMLNVLESVLPHFLQHHLTNSCSTSQEVFAEHVNAVCKLSSLINALITSCESLSRNFNRSQLDPSNRLHTSHSPATKEDNMEFSRLVSSDAGASMAGSICVTFVSPRNHLLLIVCHYYKHCHQRLKEISSTDPSLKTPELLDHKSHLRLADIAHSLLKLAAVDPAILNCPGLQMYMSSVLAYTNWSQASIRSALNNILRRIERLFGKILKNILPLIKLNWESITHIIQAIDTTLCNCPFIGHLPQMKAVVSTLLQIVTGEDGLGNIGSCYSLHPRIDNPASSSTIPYPPHFSAAAIHLSLRLLYILGDTYSLENMCEGSSGMPPSPEKLMCLVSNLIIPSILTFSSHKLNIEHLRPAQADATYILSMLLHAIHPTYRTPISSHAMSSALNSTSIAAKTNVNESRTVFWSNRANKLLPENFNKVIFLGLKSLITCFDKQLSQDWYQISKVLSQMVAHRMGGVDLWSLIDFIVSHKGPLYLLLLPIIKHKLVKNISDHSKQTRLVVISRKLKSSGLLHRQSPCHIMNNIYAKLEVLKDKPEMKKELPKEESFPRFDLLYKNLKAKKTDLEKNIKITNRKESKNKNELKTAGQRENDETRNGENKEGKKEGKRENKVKTTEQKFKNNIAFSHVLNCVVEMEQGNLILYDHMRNRKKIHVERDALYAQDSHTEDIDKEALGDNSNLTLLRSEVHRLQRQDAKSRKTFKFKRAIGSFSRRKEAGVVRSATVKRENRDLMPLQRCRNTASAEVAINEKEDTKTLSCGTNGSPSETFHKRYKSRFAQKNAGEMRGFEVQRGSKECLKDEQCRLLDEEGARCESPLQISEEDLKAYRC